MQASCSIDGSSHHREVKSIRRADVSVNDVTNVKADAKPDRWLTGSATTEVNRRDAVESIARCLDCTLAGVAAISLIQSWEHDENCVPDKMEDLAALCRHCGFYEFEVGVEHLKQLRPRQRFSERRKIAKVAEPDGGVDDLSLATTNAPLQNAPTSARADIRVKQRESGAMSHEYFKGESEDVGQNLEFGDIKFRKATWKIGGN